MKGGVKGARKQGPSMNLQDRVAVVEFICKAEICQSRPYQKKILNPQLFLLQPPDMGFLSYVHGRGNQALSKNPD